MSCFHAPKCRIARDQKTYVLTLLFRLLKTSPKIVSILSVGILFIIWQNIGTCSNSQSSYGITAGGDLGSANGSTHGSTASLCRPPPMTPQSGFVSNVVVYADCHSANKGLFAGLIVLVGSAISIILFLLAMADR